MPRFNVEFSGVIDADTEGQAAMLAGVIVSDTRKAYQFPRADRPKAVVASFDCEVVTPKVKP